MKRVLWGAAAVALAALAAMTFQNGGGQPVGAAPAAMLSLAASDRVLILAPHPDDETIACGGVIQAAVELGVPLRIVYLTHGDNNEWSFAVYRKRPVVEPKAVRAMGEVRHAEAIEAARRLGVSSNSLAFLGYPDFGSLDIWYAHWADRPPLRSMLTEVTAVPYADAMRPGAAYKGEEIVRDVSAIISEFQPTKIFLSHPWDHNPDHRALYLFTTVALWDLKLSPRVELYPYLVHWPRWPMPRGFHPTSPLSPPAGLSGDDFQWRERAVTPSAAETKRLAVEAHRTQYGYSANYLLSFVRANELFGWAPDDLAPSRIETAEMSAPEGGAGDEPDALTEEERAHFVGIERREIIPGKADIEIRFAFSRSLEEATTFSVYVFGYRPDVPFARMPKLHVKIGLTRHEVFDQDRPVPGSGVTVTRDRRSISVVIPYAALNGPDRVLTSARTYMGELPLDWRGWEIIRLPASGEEVASLPNEGDARQPQESP